MPVAAQFLGFRQNKRQSEMKKFILLLFLCFPFQGLMAQNHIQRDTTQGYAFEINYWYNLHSFLWIESFLNVNQDSTIIDQNLPDNDTKSLETALIFYRTHFGKQDIRRNDYLSSFKDWVTSDAFDLDQVPETFGDHIEVLKNVDSVYRTHFWSKHERACLSVLNQNIDLIRRTEERFVVGITKLTRQFWQGEKIKVDITYFGLLSNRNLTQRPYTTLFPTHLVMTAVGENDVEGNWVELLFHESAHHLILSRSYFIAGTIKDYCEVMNVRSPRDLGHSYLFYLTGELTKQIFAEEGLVYDQTYMQRNGVFSRYYGALDVHLKAYMNREITLHHATEKIINDLS